MLKNIQFKKKNYLIWEMFRIGRFETEHKRLNLSLLKSYGA
jgi:hypothetical protein